MIQLFHVMAEIILATEKAFKGHLKLLIYSFLICSLFVLVLSRISVLFGVISQRCVSIIVFLYMIASILFAMMYITLILKQWCSSKKERSEVLSKVGHFFLRLLPIFPFVIVPPLFFNYLVLWIEGCFSVLKTIKFWIFVLLEIFVYGLMIAFNFDFNIILIWCLVCEIYLLLWIYNTEYKKEKNNTSKKVKK